MIERVALMAPVSPPLTGASSISIPASARRAEMRRVTSGERVVMSMWTRPWVRAFDDAVGAEGDLFDVGCVADDRDDDFAVLGDVLRAATPRSRHRRRRASMPGRLRFQTVRAWPAVSRLRPWGDP